MLVQDGAVSPAEMEMLCCEVDTVRAPQRAYLSHGLHAEHIRLIARDPCRPLRFISVAIASGCVVRVEYLSSCRRSMSWWRPLISERRREGCCGRGG